MSFKEYKSASYWQEQRRSAKVMDFVGIAVAAATLAACLVMRAYA